ncbi:HEAT repeat domain-containing protein [Iningainema tapete]|uniref:HEAT repeat domain-containing protein n=1 Tax=Iningainema tapete BLCC-T55 TaxID=2748662 RepID=A0A8J6XHS4_9CYAN|nr:HEAT repeat domain-containing protein [Iningainema tapete]MBD2777080.1 HEAT repeat domain-containing protein [Iningainema tapete BLCC-T55]
MSINQLLEQAQTAYDTADWSSLSQYLQMILGEDLEQPEIEKNRQHLLELALAVLAVGDFQQRWDVVKVFNRLGKIAIAPLIDILADEDAEEELRWYAARILGELKNSEAIAPLVELIKTNAREELRMMAASALGQIGQDAIAALTELLTEENTRLLAVRSLCYIREKAIITPLLSVVQDSQVAVRATAIEALSSFHDTRVPPILLNALDDVAAPVRKEAVQGLGFRPDLCSELDLVTRLQPRLYDLNEDVCCAAASALSRMGCDAAACSLFQVLMSPHTPLKLQLEIIRALSWVETLSGLEYLQQAMNQLQSLTLWQEIVRVLGRVQQPQLTNDATKILLEMLQTGHPAVNIATVRSAIALSLGQLGKMQAVEPLTEMLADEDDSVRLHAYAALNNLRP